MSELPPELNPRGPRHDASTPPAAPSRARRRWPRVVAWMSTALAVVLLVISAGGYVYYHNLDSRITRENIRAGIDPATGTVNKAADDRSVNVLLIGADSRSGLSASDLASLHTDPNGGAALSDTMILVHIPADNTKVTMVSIPRDTHAWIPAWTSPAGQTTPAHWGKINSAFSEGNLHQGNAALSVATVELLTGMHVDHYMQVNFESFATIVNALGGVDVCISQADHDQDSGSFLPTGVNHLDGLKALSFVRNRHQFPSSDLTRIQRQQYFLAQIFKKATSAGVLLNPVTLNNTLSSVTSALITDQDFSLNEIKNVALRIRNLSAGNVAFYTLPITGRQVSGSDLEVDQTRVYQLFSALGGERPDAKYGPISTPAAVAPSAGPSSGITVPAGNVHVRVLNASGKSGLALKAADDLRAAGFVVVGVGTAPVGTLSQTQVRHSAVYSDSGRTLGSALPYAKEQVVSNLGSILEVYVGSDWTGVGAHPTGSTSPSSSPSPSPTASAPPPNSTADSVACVV